MQIFFYSTGIYRNAGVPESAIEFAVVGTCAVNVCMTVVAVSRHTIRYDTIRDEMLF